MTSEQTTDEALTSGFDGLGIAPKLLAVLRDAGFEAPTPIQVQAIPAGLEGQDIIGIAQTGTGKTIAFAIPILQRLARSGGQGLIILPTRELALQVDEELQKIARRFGLRTAILIGGASMNPQLDQLKKNPHVIVATPGRLIDHLERKSVSLDRIRMLVFDEADRMLDMGFLPQIRRIMKTVPEDRQTMLFSATMPDEIARLARQFMRQPVRIEVSRAGTAPELVEQQLYVVQRPDKLRLLKHLLEEEGGSVLVFSRTRFGAKRITRDLRRSRHNAAEIHSDRTLAQRREALDGFKSGKYRILVATDIAARGIDVTGISLVVNYDVPEQAEDYVHRIGRTGRADRRGRAVSFAEPEQGPLIDDIEQLIQIRLFPVPLPITPSAPPPNVSSRSSRRRPAGQQAAGRRRPAPRRGPRRSSGPRRPPRRRR
ncbi:hypothetical protein AMJ57_01880 [Parcubacteria bacterium SG8_24]|nr:MAG: hypothetical protein AMJ57_01880 [Parcubacteria bacterium SG8_24]